VSASPPQRRRIPTAVSPPHRRLRLPTAACASHCCCLPIPTLAAFPACPQPCSSWTARRAPRHRRSPTAHRFRPAPSLRHWPRGSEATAHAGAGIPWRTRRRHEARGGGAEAGVVGGPGGGRCGGQGGWEAAGAAARRPGAKRPGRFAGAGTWAAGGRRFHAPLMPRRLTHHSIEHATRANLAPIRLLHRTVHASCLD